MKRNYLLRSLCMMLLLTVSIASFSQDKKEQKTPEQKAQRMTDKMKADLTLTTDQVGKVQAANLDFVNKMAALKSDGSAQGQAFKDKMKPLQDEHNATLKGILTPDQYTKLEGMKNHGDHGDHKMKKKES